MTLPSKYYSVDWKSHCEKECGESRLIVTGSLLLIDGLADSIWEIGKRLSPAANDKRDEKGREGEVEERRRQNFEYHDQKIATSLVVENLERIEDEDYVENPLIVAKFRKPRNINNFQLVDHEYPEENEINCCHHHWCEEECVRLGDVAISMQQDQFIV